MLRYASSLFDFPVVAPMYYLPYYSRFSLCIIGLQHHWCTRSLRTKHDHDEDLSRWIIAMVCRIKQFRGLPWAQLLLFRFSPRAFIHVARALHVTISVVCDPHVLPSALLIFTALQVHYRAFRGKARLRRYSRLEDMKIP